MSKIISLHWFYKTYHHGIIEEKKTTSDNNILGKHDENAESGGEGY
jgi:hypothetical protein